VNLTPEQVEALRKEGKRELWYRGDLRHILRPHGQTRVYDFTHAWKDANPDRLGPIIWNCHRAMGKTFGLLTFCVERALRYPDQEIRFGAPALTQCKEIVGPIITAVLAQCPPELYPEITAQKMVFRNPRWGKPNSTSTIHLVSCKDDAENQRGPRSDLIVIDECRDIARLEYVVRDVFTPHFAERHLPLLILSSTPPNSNDHPFREFVENAIKAEQYVRVPGSENQDFTLKTKAMLLESLGPESKHSWQREIECSLIPDRDLLIIPEFQDVKHEVVVDQYERPKWYFPHICTDFGFMDYSAVLYGYNDFQNQTLVIEDEIFVNYKTTGDLARLMREKEAEVFKDAPYPVVRYGDNDIQQLADLRGDYKYSIRPVDKWDKESACSRLRTRFQSRRIRILSKCQALIFQLDTALRKENGDFERSERYGHADAIAALIYLNRALNFQANPYPLDEDYDPNEFILRTREQPGSIEVTNEPLVITNRRIA
jgi:terminase large subunit-like protein